MSAGETYLTAGQLLARARELGAEITRDYEGRDLVLVVPLRGCFVFAVDLSRARLAVRAGILSLAPPRCLTERRS